MDHNNYSDIIIPLLDRYNRNENSNDDGYASNSEGEWNK